MTHLVICHFLKPWGREGGAFALYNIHACNLWFMFGAIVLALSWLVENEVPNCRETDLNDLLFYLIQSFAILSKYCYM